MPCIIKIPIRTHEEFGYSIAKLIALVNQIRTCNLTDIEFDFTQARMINPFFLGGLACIISSLEKEGKVCTINYGNGGSIKSYLNTICFPNGFSLNLEDVRGSLSTLENYKYRTYIPIVRFKTGTLQSEKILSTISDLLRFQLGFTQTELQPFSYFIGELTANIYEHSNASEGYVFAQYYPKTNYVDFCICDAGQGIYNSFLGTFTPESEAHALQLAMSGNSTKGGDSRGFGLTTTRDMLVRGLRGKLFIWSGSASFVQSTENEGIMSMDKTKSFPGTFIALRLPTIIPGSFNFYNFIEG